MARGHRAYTDPSAAGVRGRMHRLQPDNNWEMTHSFTWLYTPFLTRVEGSPSGLAQTRTCALGRRELAVHLLGAFCCASICRGLSRAVAWRLNRLLALQHMCMCLRLPA